MSYSDDKEQSSKADVIGETLPLKKKKDSCESKILCKTLYRIANNVDEWSGRLMILNEPLKKLKKKRG